MKYLPSTKNISDLENMFSCMLDTYLFMKLRNEFERNDNTYSPIEVEIGALLAKVVLIFQYIIGRQKL